MRRIDPSDTPHNTGTLYSFDSPYRPHSINISHTYFYKKLQRYHAIPGYEVQAPGTIKKEISYINFSLIPDLERAGDRQDIPKAPVECITIDESGVKKTGGKKTKSKSGHNSGSPVIQIPLASKSLNISDEELGVYYEKEDKRDRKFMEKVNRILTT
ncbi:hypothetical protein GLOIN_2v1770749 [Rhizophagus clarus]|uniref:Uncharacterized protein n=1 Tax=Rhizophagus clarus TaxID=94130 RepID=A0A8H3LA65_9GLOM|nr:hypothetical protein GLOIN_2v1770749 [Rhizophagus clarus]